MRLTTFFLLFVLASNTFANDINTAKRYIRLHDYPNAVKLLTRLAQQNNPEAQYQLGVLYRNGTGVRRDYELSRKWLLKACLAGHAKAQYSLANLFHNGLGVTPDNKKALKWYTMAAKQGHVKAADQLRRIKQGGIEPANSSSPNQQLLQAAQRGSLSKIRYFIKKGANINYSDNTGTTALMLAAQNGFIKIVTHLIRHNADLDHKNKFNEYALLLATKNNHADITAALLAAKAKHADPDKNDMDPLMYAVTKNNTTIIRSLLKAGANPSRFNRHRQSAITLAQRDKNNIALDIFQKHGAHIPSSGSSAKRGDNLGAIKSAASDSESATMIAAARGQISALKKLLIAEPHSIKKADMHNMTALSYAVANKQAAAVELLLKAGSDPNIRHQDGTTPIFIAAKDGSIKIVTHLLEHGANVNAINSDGESPILSAAKQGWGKVVLVLLKHRANPLLTDKNGYTAIDLAIINKHEDIARNLLRSAGHLIKEKLNSIMHLSAKYDATHLLADTLRAGADINSVDKEGGTALMLAASNGNIAATRVILQNNADINQMSRHGNTALILAAQRSQLGVVELLCQDKKLRLDIKNKSGNTALIESVLSNNEKIVTYLLKHGADVSIRNLDKRNAEDIATAAGFTHISKLLKSNTSKGLFNLF